MNTIILLITMIILWVIVLASLFQRLYTMPKWFENPPVSFERIRQQSKASQIFWLPITGLSLIFLIASLIVNWQYVDVRTYIFAALGCFVLNGISTGAYFVKEILLFAKMPVDAPQTPELLVRTTTWLKWTTLRNILQIISAISATIAYHIL
jgi:hypothetical protein